MDALNQIPSVAVWGRMLQISAVFIAHLHSCGFQQVSKTA
jgi:hypothetical protein